MHTYLRGFLIVPLSLAFFGLTLTSCVSVGTDGSSEEQVRVKQNGEYSLIENENTNRGKVTIGVTDAAFDGSSYTHVYLTLDDVVLLDSETNTQSELTLFENTFDLLDLKNREKIAYAGSTEVDVSTYDQIQFRVEEVLLVDADDREYTTKTHEMYTLPTSFSLEGGEHVVLLFDFELDNSILEATSEAGADVDYIFEPSILVEVHDAFQVRALADEQIVIDSSDIQDEIRVTVDASGSVNIYGVLEDEVRGVIGTDGQIDLMIDHSTSSEGHTNKRESTSSDSGFSVDGQINLEVDNDADNVVDQQMNGGLDVSGDVQSHQELNLEGVSDTAGNLDTNLDTGATLQYALGSSA